MWDGRMKLEEGREGEWKGKGVGVRSESERLMNEVDGSGKNRRKEVG